MVQNSKSKYKEDIFEEFILNNNIESNGYTVAYISDKTGLSKQYVYYLLKKHGISTPSTIGYRINMVINELGKDKAIDIISSGEVLRYMQSDNLGRVKRQYLERLTKVIPSLLSDKSFTQISRDLNIPRSTIYNINQTFKIRQTRNVDYTDIKQLILSHKTVKEICDELGCNRSTVYRHMKILKERGIF